MAVKICDKCGLKFDEDVVPEGEGAVAHECPEAPATSEDIDSEFKTEPGGVPDAEEKIAPPVE